MTHPEPSSSPDYDPYELFKDELDLDFELGLESESEQPTMERTSATASPFPSPDEDRLYTDEVIRQNEMASRFLFISVIVAGVISIGVGLWYLAVRKPTAPLPQNAPLQVPEPPPVAPLPSLSPNFSPSPAPINPGQTLPPTNSGVVPGGSSVIPSALPTPISPVGPGTTTPPPPPPAPPNVPRP